ncbi:unnamed protein product [Owenia fusiformis]|uniref:Uncharacterized protein n=1 Tax=Owenia fusiformis TaxID=6347 RepID=A0A8S4PUA9_OWEFU|nr:unnamed protein product [Owenia fusiformis]
MNIAIAKHAHLHGNSQTARKFNFFCISAKLNSRQYAKNGKIAKLSSAKLTQSTVYRALYALILLKEIDEARWATLSSSSPSAQYYVTTTSGDILLLSPTFFVDIVRLFSSWCLTVGRKN